MEILSDWWPLGVMLCIGATCLRLAEWLGYARGRLDGRAEVQREQAQAKEWRV